MRLTIYQVDAFTSSVFSGNPAAVVPLDKALDASLMQNIASENNLPETAFFYRDGSVYQLRWFTPEVEVPLCGHATLAAAAVIFEFIEPDAEVLRFNSLSGELRVKRQELGYQLDFPRLRFSPQVIDTRLVAALGKEPLELYEVADDVNVLAVFDCEQTVRALKPDVAYLKTLDSKGVIVTSKGEGSIDFVSRYFAPSMGIDEDPVTGSIHCALAPYWAEKLGKEDMRAVQVSQRVGELRCRLDGNRVLIEGQTQLYLKGEIFI